MEIDMLQQVIDKTDNGSVKSRIGSFQDTFGSLTEEDYDEIIGREIKKKCGF